MTYLFTVLWISLLAYLLVYLITYLLTELWVSLLAYVVDLLNDLLLFTVLWVSVLAVSATLLGV